jgi:signal transduction histidine kinase
MRRIVTLWFACLQWGVLSGMAAVAPTGHAVNLKALSSDQLKHRLDEIDRTCEQLASYTLRGGIGSLGYSSTSFDTPHAVEWVQVELGRDIPIDEIVLVPILWRNSKTGVSADGFPVAFKIISGTTGCTNVVASYGAEDRLLPRIAPLIVPCPGTTASWVRVEATVLSPRAWDGRYVFHLSELMVFSGQENVALRKPVLTSARAWHDKTRDKRYLVDGVVPYLMDASEGERSWSFVSQSGVGDHPALTIDLETKQPVNHINIHLVDVSDCIPQIMPSDYTCPSRILVEGATQNDFSDAVRLVEYHYETLYDVGPIIMLDFPVTRCRYVRLTALEPYISTESDKSSTIIGFAEIELLAGGRNVALGKPVCANFEILERPSKLFNVTDGLNYYGRILPVRGWMEELTRRHDLEGERPIVAAELKLRYEHQQMILKWMQWLAVMLVAGIVVTVLVDRNIRLRQMHQLKQRFAADLHDELGANLHAIGLLSDLAIDTVDSPVEQAGIIDEIRAITEQTGRAARYCADMQEAQLYGNLAEDMRRATFRIMADIEYSISIEGEALFDQLKPRARVDLFLFFKESLINISRHSCATKASITLRANRQGICLKISDNGVGLSGSERKDVPPSLRRRAQLLGADTSIVSSPNGGTCISLTLKLGKLRSIWFNLRSKWYHLRSHE